MGGAFAAPSSSTAVAPARVSMLCGFDRFGSLVRAYFDNSQPTVDSRAKDKAGGSELDREYVNGKRKVSEKEKEKKLLKRQYASPALTRSKAVSKRRRK